MKGKERHKMRKRYLLLVFLLALNLFGTSTIGTYAVPAAAPIPPELSDNGFEMMAENDYLELYLNRTTTVTAVRVKASGSIWYSNPKDWEQDERVSGVNREYIQSQIRIVYYNSSAQKSIMNNYADSIKKEQFVIKPLDDGFKITYTMGETDANLIVPYVISAERFEGFLSNMSESQQKSVLRRYILYQSSTATSAEKVAYPALKNNDLYVLREELSELVLENLSEAFAEAGYTKDDLKYDNDQNQFEIKDDKVNFVIPLVYRLDGNSLLAYVPTEEIEYPEAYPLAQIHILEFFGAAGLDREGYMLVPDGSGSLIYLNNGKTSDRQYIAKVYGRDYTFVSETKSSNTYPVTMPVFGLKQDDKAFFGIIEEGEAFATIYGRVSGIVNSYNYVSADFLALPNENLKLDTMGTNSLQVFQPEIYKGNFKLRYYFLDGEEADYSGMARCYQNYLADRGFLNRKGSSHDSLPFVLETIGSIDKKKNFLGIPYNGLVSLTTFDQAMEMMDAFRERGVDDLVLKYSGWLNGGMQQQAATKFNVVSRIGGKKGLEKLVEYINANEIPFFPEVHLNYAYGDKLFDGFSSSRNVVRSLENKIIRRPDYHLVLKVRLSNIINKAEPFIVSPSFYRDMCRSFLQKLGRYDVPGVALGSLYFDLNSDFKKNSPIDRQSAIAKVLETQKFIAEEGYMQMADGANAYALGGLDYIIGLPYDSNNLTVTDESIPFYQMVIRGYVEYAGSPFNVSSDDAYNLLKSVETGSCIYYRLFYEDNSIIKDSYYTDLYSHNFRNNFDRAVRTYQTAASVLNSVQGQRIIRHDILDEGVRLVTYENGVRIIVNYSEAPYTYGNATVEANSFAAL